VENEKKKWWASEVCLSDMEKVIWRSMLAKSVGKKKLEELKEMGDLKAVNGGVTVNLDISKEKTLSLFFGRKFDKYVYRSELFFARKEEKVG